MVLFVVACVISSDKNNYRCEFRIIKQEEKYYKCGIAVWHVTY
jgi:hypothetical protein